MPHSPRTRTHPRSSRGSRAAPTRAAPRCRTISRRYSSLRRGQGSGQGQGRIRTLAGGTSAVPCSEATQCTACCGRQQGSRAPHASRTCNTCTTRFVTDEHEGNGPRVRHAVQGTCPATPRPTHSQSTSNPIHTPKQRSPCSACYSYMPSTVQGLLAYIPHRIRYTPKQRRPMPAPTQLVPLQLLPQLLRRHDEGHLEGNSKAETQLGLQSLV